MSLPESENLQPLLLQYLHAGVIVHAPDAHILLANEYAAALLGLSPDQLVGKTALDSGWSFLREDEAPLPPDEYPVSRVLATRQPVRDLVMGIRPPATHDRIWVLANAFPELSAEGELRHIVVTFVDITTRVQAEARQQHLTDVLRAIRNVNQLIVQEKDRDTLLRRACDLLTETRGYRSAWIGRHDAAERFHTAAESGIGADFDALRAQIERGAWPACCRQALAQPDIVVVHEPTEHCGTCALARTYHDTVAFAGALRHAGRDYGVLVAVLPAAMADDAEEQVLFREIAEDIGFALHAMEAAQERDQATEALRAREQHYATIFRAGPMGICTTRFSDGLMVDVNQAFLDLFGYTREEMIGHTTRELNMWVGAEERKEVTGRLSLQGRIPSFELQVRKKSGQIGVILASTELVDIGGERYMLSMFSDITERKCAEAALRESEERFRALVDGAPEGIFVQSGGHFLFLNPAMVALLGAARAEDLLGTEFTPRIAPEYRDAVRARIRSQRETGTSAPPMDQEYLRLDGSRVPVETTAVAFRFQGQDAHLVFVRDATARRKAEAERENLQAQLLQARKMESVGRLAGGVAHDFNNILMVQRGYCEMIKLELREGDPLAEGLAQIDACAERATALTRQLLAFSRKQPLQPRDFDLNALLRNLDDMLRRLIGEDVDLVIAPAPAPAMVRADPGQIEQVIVNLAVNARDAMPQGGRLTIEVSQVELDKAYIEQHIDVVPGPYVMLAVSDTGCGMDDEIRSHIFEPFFTTKSEGKGTGLGLSTVYGIVRQSGGNVWVYSEPGKGTAFKVYLPRVQAEPTQIARQETRVTRGAGELVLVVEDEPALRTLAMRMIERLGYRSSEAANAGTAHILVEEQGLRPDLLITDMVMPGMSGRVLVERLRQTVPDVKVIYMSGYTDNAIVHHGLLDAGISFLQKPFSMADLGARIRSVLAEG